MGHKRTGACLPPRTDIWLTDAGQNEKRDLVVFILVTKR